MGLFDPPDPAELPCDICGGTGFAEVPHINHVIDGVWLPYPGRWWRPTFTVSCQCSDGYSRAARCSGIMSLEKYDSLNRGWQRQLAMYRKEYQEVMYARRFEERTDADIKQFDRAQARLLRIYPDPDELSSRGPT